MNEKAPLTVRVNPIKITRDKLFEKWIKVDKFLVKKCDYSPMGITFLSPLKVYYRFINIKGKFV
jgi:hypothetical protein